MLRFRESLRTTQKLIARIRENLLEAEKLPLERREQRVRLVSLDAIVLANRVEMLIEEIQRELNDLPKRQRVQAERVTEKTVRILHSELQSIQTKMIVLAAA